MAGGGDIAHGFFSAEIPSLQGGGEFHFKNSNRNKV